MVIILKGLRKRLR